MSEHGTFIIQLADRLVSNNQHTTTTNAAIVSQIVNLAERLGQASFTANVTMAERLLGGYHQGRTSSQQAPLRHMEQERQHATGNTDST
jgi:hypothetical protein